MDYHMILYNVIKELKGLVIVFKDYSDNPISMYIYIYIY